MKVINGKKVHITRAGYLYIDGKKIGTLVCTPISGPATDDEDIEKYKRARVWRHYVMGY